MADLALARRATIDSVNLHAPADLVSMRVLPPMGRFSFRGSAEAALACGSAFGVALPTTANSASVAGELAALWLGPDEWLLLCPEGAFAAAEVLLADALQAMPHSLVDISHRQIAIEIAGPKAATLLNAGVLLDLGEAAFPVNAATRTIFAKTEIILWRKAADIFQIEVWRSFAPYLTGLLSEASRGMPG